MRIRSGKNRQSPSWGVWLHFRDSIRRANGVFVQLGLGPWFMWVSIVGKPDSEKMSRKPLDFTIKQEELL